MQAPAPAGMSHKRCEGREGESLFPSRGALLKQAQELGWAEWIERCQAIPGVGPLTAMALVASWCRSQFRRVDAFVAFLGVDVRVKQSGRWQGRCKLTKKGDGEVRRLLYNAAMQGRRSSVWVPCYLRLREPGMSSTAALVALSRELARVSFALLRTDTRFVPSVPENACVSTHRIYPPPPQVRRNAAADLGRQIATSSPA